MGRDDGLRFCEALIDQWDAPITYEDVRLWRDICEYLNLRKSPTGSHYIKLRIPGCDYLVGYDRTHRQKLWDKFKIQLITYEKFSKYEGWRLKGNWEDKIDFLEQVYILGRDPNQLPRPWLDKWERKVEQRKQGELINILDAIIWNLDEINNPVCPSEHKYRFNVEGVSFQCQRARAMIASLKVFEKTIKK